MLDAQGRVVMVSGASRGIGRAVAERLLESGFAVSAGVRNPDALPEHPRLSRHRYDAEDLASAEAWVAGTVARHGRVDGLVNAAGINPMAGLHDADETALDALWRVNVKGPTRLIRLAWAHLAAAGHGRVVNLSSLSGKRVKNANLGYAMSKFAVVALTHEVRREGWEQGIRATAVCPSFVDTDMTGHVTSWPREKMTQPADLARLIETCLLLPDEAVVAELLVNCRLEDLF
ncbi:SDR family NAD(P)-dependent oxidoreductase [Roseomonas gilardii]|uniref:SDR family NAD(P)-dependent oxidoreductase n=1 Tax=Roseomonas gilardii TaxID=257708 RepID=UPI00119F6CCE|nr:SDR family NAD(P)-dependent oxidoreductase [Roseomonas gilardii]